MINSKLEKYKTIDNLVLMDVKAIAVPEEQLEKLNAKEIPAEVEAQVATQSVIEEPVVDTNIAPVTPVVEEPIDIETPINAVIEEQNIFDAPKEEVVEESINEVKSAQMEEPPRIEQVNTIVDPVEIIQNAFEQLGVGINALIEENQKTKKDLLKYLNDLSKTTTDFDNEVQRKKSA